MTGIKKIVACVMVGLSLSFWFPVAADGVQEDTESDVQALLGYYLHYQSQGKGQMEAVLEKMEEEDPEKAALWRRIMTAWICVNEEMPPVSNELPDGLPEDDSLCIVVLGYDLKNGGGMKKELLARLEVALASANKYPNAFVALTGGETSQVEGVTEAGEMAKWLQQKGIAPDRLIVETDARTTTQNVQNVYGILEEAYPQVRSVAVISSDYHIPWSSILFYTMTEYSAWAEGKTYPALVAAAACETGKTRDTLKSQAKGIAAIAGIPFDSEIVPEWAEPEQISPDDTQVSECSAEEAALAETEAPQPTKILEVSVEVNSRGGLWMPLLGSVALAAAILLAWLVKKYVSK